MPSSVRSPTLPFRCVVVVLQLTCSVLGCSRKASTDAAPSSSAAGARPKVEVARGEPSAAAAVTPSAVASVKEPASPNPAEPPNELPLDGSAASADDVAVNGPDEARLKEYWKAIGEGRVASVKKNYSVALAAFDRALEALPDDARAYSERGYAQLLAENLSSARADFDRAALLTTDSKLLAQIWFNYGLTAEQEGRAEDARSAFARSNELNPTKAASAKLGERSTCTLRIKQDQRQLGGRPAPAARPEGDFLDAFKSLAEGKRVDKVPATADAARLLLCPVGDCVLTPGMGSPIRLQLGDSYGAVIALTDKTLRIFRNVLANDAKPGPCGAKDVVSVRHQQPLHFRLQRTPMVERFELPNHAECTEASASSCVKRCVEGTTLVQDILFSAPGDECLLGVEQWALPGGKLPLEVSVTGSDARILGSGCDISWDLK